jgi:predicted CoA-binding protein
VTTLNQAAATFLGHKRIAVTGVKPHAQGHGGNAVYKRLRERGYETFAVNPAEDEVEGDRCYHSLKDIPGGVDAVVIAGEADATEGTVRDCVDLGIGYVWMHRALGVDSVSASATGYGRENGVLVIDGGCPLMFGPTSDVGHKVIRALLTPTGRVPRTCA